MYKIIKPDTKEDQLKHHLSVMDLIFDHEINGYFIDFQRHVEKLKEEYSDLVNNEEIEAFEKVCNKVDAALDELRDEFDKLKNKFIKE